MAILVKPRSQPQSQETEGGAARRAAHRPWARLPKLSLPGRAGPRRASLPGTPPAQPAATPTVLSSALTMVALISLWIVAQVLFLGGLSYERDQSLLYGQLREQLASATAPVGPVVEPGAPVAMLNVERLGLNEVVVEGTASGDLLAGPGHRRDSVLPGQAGTSVVYGRATSYGAPFRHLGELREGDKIEVVSAQGTKRFRVMGVRRAGDPLPQPLAAGSARLTLVSAEGDGRWAAFTPTQAVYVDADLLGKKPAFPAPPGRPMTVPASEQVMASDSTALPSLVLILAALVALALGVVIARQRWSAVLVWVIAAPITLTCAWLATDVVMRLLPNLL